MLSEKLRKKAVFVRNIQSWFSENQPTPWLESARGVLNILKAFLFTSPTTKENCAWKWRQIEFLLGELSKLGISAQQVREDAELWSALEEGADRAREEILDFDILPDK
jgi:hypothetical protein